MGVLYNVEEQPVEWMGSSRKDLRGFPVEARGEAGQGLFPEAVYVLHAFQKKTRATAPHDLHTARERYREMLERRGKGD
jgi:phage-related protein